MQKAPQNPIRALIRAISVTKRGQRWIVFGSADGAAVLSLASGLPKGSEIYGVDLTLPGLPLVSKLANGVTMRFYAIDFFNEMLLLPYLDGMMLQDVISLVPNPSAWLCRLNRFARGVHFCILVERQLEYLKLESLLYSLGYTTVTLLTEGKKSVVLAER